MISDVTLDRMVTALVDVPGIEAVVLGGSRARGTHGPDSDVDLGLYHDPARLDVEALSRLAAGFTGAPVEVACPGGWGPWVDGGAWLVVDGTHVDWILRDTGRVREQCGRAVRGEFAFRPQPGHPLGFLDVSYAGEVATCRPLADPSGVVAALAADVTPYPPALRAAMVGNLWQVGLLGDAAAKGVPKQDVAFVSLCLSTAAMLVAHGFHAVAGEWVTHEKGLVPGVARLGLDDGGFADEMTALLADVGAGEDALARTVGAARTVLDEATARVRRLAG